MITRIELHNVNRVTQQLQQFGTFSVLRISAYVDSQALPMNFELFINSRDGLPIEPRQIEVIQEA
jgi:hypothetical protein